MRHVLGGVLIALTMLRAVARHAPRIIRRATSPSWCRSRRAAAPTCWRAWSAPKMEQRLGKSFIVENRPGAGTTIAAGATAKAAPDGYTLMQATSGTMAMNPDHLQKPALHAGEGSGAGFADRRRAVRAGGQSGAAGAQRRRPGEARQGEAADLRLRRRRRVPSSQRRAVQQHDRHQDDARSLQGQRAVDDRADRGTRSTCCSSTSGRRSS